MSSLARWLAPAALAAALGAGALFPAPARADDRRSDDMIRVIVDVADIAFRSGQPYYRHGRYGYDDRLIVERDHRGRPVYYRYVPRDGRYRNGYYGDDHYSRNGFVRDPYGRYSRQRCDSRGRCRVEYYDPRYDRDGRDYGYNDRRYPDRYWDGRRWRDRD
ncbi:MAG: hypothetical protein V4673_06255 [Pseudomonadota bacterium]